MRIGVVSDTHNNLKNTKRIVALFGEANVDAVIHTGDITKGSTLALFADLTVPLHGVFGNNDVERQGLDEVIEANGFHFAEPPLQLNLDDHNLVVVHDPRLLEGLELPFRLALHGHTHMFHKEYIQAEQLVFNPGECAGHMQGHNAIGVVDLNSLETELLKF